MDLKRTASGKIKMSKRDWYTIGKQAGWIERMAADRGEKDDVIELWDDAREESVEVDVILEYTVEPTEYEGGYLFYQGGVLVEDVKLAQDLDFMGKHYEAGMPFPEELMQYSVNEYESVDEYLERMSEILSESEDIEVPTRHYRGIR